MTLAERLRRELGPGVVFSGAEGVIVYEYDYGLDRGMPDSSGPTRDEHPRPLDRAVGEQAAVRGQRRDPEARAKREESDFLAVGNHDGEMLDFHSLRHTCGSWLALQGVHPNIIKTVMRHSTIKLTADWYDDLGLDREGAGA